MNKKMVFRDHCVREKVALLRRERLEREKREREEEENWKADLPTLTRIQLLITQARDQLFEQEIIEGKAGHVYFLQNNEYTKIGYSTQLNERIAHLQREFPGARLLHTVPSINAFATEQWLHNYFKHKHYCKEWYKLDENDMEIVESMCNPTREPQELLTDKGRAQLQILVGLGISVMHMENNSRIRGYLEIEKVKND